MAAALNGSKPARISLTEQSFPGRAEFFALPGHLQFQRHHFFYFDRIPFRASGIASSASVFADDQRLALASGFNDFLPKPVMEEELFEIGKTFGLKMDL